MREEKEEKCQRKNFIFTLKTLHLIDMHESQSPHTHQSLLTLQ